MTRSLYEYDPAVGFRFIPNLRTRVPHDGGGYLVRTNGLGFRSDRQFEHHKSPTSRRVLLFGDSFTAGDGVSNGHRYSDVLERLIPGIEVYNFGMPATGTDQQYLIYRSFAGEIEHDLLILGVFVENIRRVASRYRHFRDDQGRMVLYAKPYFTLEDSRLVLNGVPPAKHPVPEAAVPPRDQRYIFTRARYPRLKSLYRRLRQFRAFEQFVVSNGIVSRVQRAIRYQPITEYDDPAGAAWRTMRAIIAEWVRNHPRPVLLIPIPLYQYVAGLSRPAYQQRLREVVTSAGGSFWDPLPHLMAYPPERRRDFFYHQSDGHLTKAGHAALGEALAPVVNALLQP